MLAEIEKQRDGLDLIKINNDQTKIVFSNYGARIVSWKYEDNNIVLGNVVEADEFYHDNPFKFGATIGRYAGRIEGAQFKLDGKTYRLEANEGEHHLHGGSTGLDQSYFDYDIIEEANRVKIIFKTRLTEACDHFPGNIELQVIHTYDMSHTWTVEYKATSTARTLFNPTNHVYFNLNRDNNLIDNHVLCSDQLWMIPLSKNHIPEPNQSFSLTELFKSKSVQFDTLFGSKEERLNPQMSLCGGVDHPFTTKDGELTIENKDFSLTVKTDRSHIVIYTLNDSVNWQSPFNIFKAHSGFTLETQSIPNDINSDGEQANSILEKDTPFYSKTSYQVCKK